MTSKYFLLSRNMWNYVDVMTLSLHALILVLRIISICLGGDPYHNPLLEVVNHFYGITTLLLVLRFSSILEVNKTVGPLQLALFRMCIDLAIILIQFFFCYCGIFCGYHHDLHCRDVLLDSHRTKEDQRDSF